MRFGHLAQRLFNRPLAIHPGKAEVVMSALADRLGVISLQALQPKPSAGGFDENDWGFSSNNVSPDAGYDLADGVAVIEVSGTLVHRLGSLRPYSGMTGYDGIREAFGAAQVDPEVRAIVLMVDSPGGEVSGCFDLVDAIYAARGDKPVWAILDEAAFSAAYAIASAADRIIVPRTGGVGSIGVIAMHVDWSKALSQAGLVVTFIQYGDRKADGHPEIPLSPEAREAFQAEIDAMGELFVSTVARNRGLDANAVRATQAACYLGPQGVALGLADAVMAPADALQSLLASLA
jgi:signal peptide peptidase SppA